MAPQVGNLEITVLSLLRRREYYLRYKELISRDFFFSVESKTIYKMVVEFHEKSRKITFITVKRLWMLLEKYIDEDDERLYKRLLVKIKKADTKDRETIHFSLTKFAQRHRANAMVQTVANQLQGGIDLDLDSIRKEVDRLISLDGAGKPRTNYDYFSNGQARLTEDIRTGRVPTGIHTTIDDAMKGGLGPGELGFFLGPPKRGKTFTLVNVGANALREGRKVLHITLEIQAKHVGRRYDMNLARATWTDIVDNPDLINDARQLIKDNKGELTILDYSYTHCSVATLSAYLEENKRAGKRPYDLVVVDFADLMTPPTRYKEAGRFGLLEIYQELRIVAGSYNIPIWTASQGNRGSVKKSVVTEEDIAEAFNKVGICDIMISLNQTMDEKEEKEMRLFVAANRIGGGNPIVRVRSDTDRMLLEDIDAPTNRRRPWTRTVRNRLNKTKSK